MQYKSLKLSVIGFTSLILTACAAPQYQTQVTQITPAPVKKYAVTALSTCPSCISQLRGTPGTRLIKLKVQTDTPSLDIVYTYIPKDFKNNKFHIATGSFDGVIQIPENVDVYVTGSDYRQGYILVGGTTISSKQNSAVINLRYKHESEVHKEEFNKLTMVQKKNFMQVLNLYRVAINSPKMLFSSKLSEANGAADLFSMDMPKGFQETDLYNDFKFMRSSLDMAEKMSSRDLPPVGLDTAIEYLDKLEKNIKPSF
jgi:hypothetical protein